MLNPFSPLNRRLAAFRRYQERRRADNEATGLKLSGRWFFISSRPLTLPLSGVDMKVDHAVVNQQIRDVTLITKKNGEQFRVGREKGTSYRHPSKAEFPQMKRAERRRLCVDWRAPKTEMRAAA
jgi:hypothetical protein